MDKLTILVSQEWLAHPQVLELAEKGHIIEAAPIADLILAPYAWQWSDHSWKYIGAALKEARKVNRLKPKKEVLEGAKDTGNGRRRKDRRGDGADRKQSRKGRKPKRQGELYAASVEAAS